MEHRRMPPQLKKVKMRIRRKTMAIGTKKGGNESILHKVKGRVRLLGLVCFACCLTALQNVEAILDANSNGMSDVWEKRFGAESLQPGLDQDGDGQNNLSESLAGTDPFSAASVLEVLESEHHSDGVIIRWQSKVGVRYQVEQSLDLGQNWANVGDVMEGNGVELTAAFAKAGAQRSFYRIKILPSDVFNNLHAEAVGLITPYDTDDDGISDLDEIRSGTNPFDLHLGVPSPKIDIGSGTTLEWDSVMGKTYYIEKVWQEGGPYEFIGGPYRGTGERISASVVYTEGSPGYLRVVVQDEDTDEDGLADWEELQVKLDPEIAMSDPYGPGDYTALQTRLAATDVITVKASNAVANITRMEDGGFLIEREGGIGELTVSYSIGGTAVAGSDYQALTGNVTIPFGEDSVGIPVKPLAGSAMSLSESVILTLQDTSAYDLGMNSSQQVNVLKEVAINVKDYGAVGDGVVDDTAAIQSAIADLETSSTHNTLFFPSGKYRLTSYFPTPATPTGSYRLLRMGHNTDLAGRDLILRGETGSTLYSDVGARRAHMLLVKGGFRSILFTDLRFEQSSSLLWSSAGSEPNGSDGVVIVSVDDRNVEDILFKNCTFYNCHRSVSIYGIGYDLKGKCESVVFKECEFLNPYGSNTSNGASAWGGGQQIYLAPWVDRAVYEDCLFDGGAEDMTDTSLTGGGRMKDGCHFGGPLNLVFRNNVVKRMSVEAVYHTNDVTFMARTLASFVMPADDGVSTVDVTVSSHPSTWVVGDKVVIHQSLVEGSTASSNHFIVDSYNAGSSVLTLKHAGDPDNAPAGSVISAAKHIYRDTEPESPTAVIEGNYLDGTLPPGGKAFPERSGIVFESRALVQNNVVANFTAGIFSYVDTHTPHFPAARGAIVRRNVVITKNAFEDSNVSAKGIYLAAEDQMIHGNLIICPVSFKTYGILHRGRRSRVVENVLLCDQIMRNDYNSWDRAVGIAQSNTGIHMLAIGNKTRGFDVGIGPGQAHQWRVYYMRGHDSYEDTLAIDPIGLTAEP